MARLVVPATYRIIQTFECLSVGRDILDARHVVAY